MGGKQRVERIEEESNGRLEAERMNPSIDIESRCCKGKGYFSDVRKGGYEP